MTTNGEFLTHIETWFNQLKSVQTDNIFNNPKHTAIISVDVINGFCKFGPLASPRVATIIEPIVELLENSWKAGCENIIFIQDTHEPDAVEFNTYPPHCVRGTEEAETVDEIKSLPFFDRIPIIEKNSIDAGANTALDSWISEHPAVNTYIIVGDCTDLCTYQLAMHIRLKANALQKEWRVIVPENCVDTYDTSIETAQQIGAFAHPGDFFHKTFLYHMALNGIEVYNKIHF